MPIIIAPIFDPDRGWREWLKSDIYTGALGTGRYVPNVNDKVFDWVGGIFRVTAVDAGTGLSTLVAWSAPDNAGINLEEDIFLSSGPGGKAESWRLFIDKSVMPHTLTVDARIHIYSASASYIKVFKGTDITNTGIVISSYYDQSDNLLGENIPLENATVPDLNNVSIKAPKTGYTSYELNDGEPCTVVSYSDAGNVISTAVLLTKVSSFIRSMNAGQKYITGIELESPFLSSTNDRLLEIPNNITLDSVPLMGVVTYSNGDKLRLPIDGNKFTLYGRDTFISSIMGQRIPLVLDYRLSSDEINYVSQSSHNHHIPKDYEATTIEWNGTYSCKLFVFPVWNLGEDRYHLEYVLYNLDRELFFWVTPLIEVPENANVFNPLLFGSEQSLTVAIDIAQVNGLFTEYRHVQTFKVALLKPGNVNNFDESRWIITYDPAQNPTYGPGLIAKSIYSSLLGYWDVDIACEATSQEVWLQRIYYAGKPLFNPDEEALAPVPTHFRIFTDLQLGHHGEYAIGAWNTPIVIPAASLDNGEVVYIQFIKRTVTTDLQIGIGALPFRADYVP